MLFFFHLVPVVGIRLVRLVLRLSLVRLLVDVPVHPTHGGGTLVPGGLAQGAPVMKCDQPYNRKTEKAMYRICEPLI